MKPVTLLMLAALASAPDVAKATTLFLSDGPGSATCAKYDAASGVAWRAQRGDWRDATGTLQGDEAFATEQVADVDQRRPVTFDITGLVHAWLSGSLPNHGILLRPIGRGRPGDVNFFSREAQDASARPVLLLEFANGEERELPAAADSYLNCTTIKPLGKQQMLAVGGGSSAVLRFEIPSTGSSGGLPKRATLRLTTTERQRGDVEIGVFRLDPPLDVEAILSPPGIAAAYRRDEGLDRDAAAIVVEGFEDANWPKRWSHVGMTDTWSVVERDPALRFEPLKGKALKVRVPKGKHLALDVRYLFKDKLGREPEEAYFRYYLRLADDWRPTLDGGKLPGFMGTYDRGGWGGRRSDGYNGWSLRGSFGRQIEAGHPLAGFTPIGTYAYHADMRDKYGDGWPWSRGRPGTLQRNRWYCIEQYVKLNHPEARDGVLRVWIDGVLAYERSDIRMRKTEELKIEGVWLDIYHGGTAVSPHDQHMYLDGIVVARSYIGTMAP